MVVIGALIGSDFSKVDGQRKSVIVQSKICRRFFSIDNTFKTIVIEVGLGGNLGRAYIRN